MLPQQRHQEVAFLRTRPAGIGPGVAPVMPVDVIVLWAAPCRNLRRLGLQLLQTNDIGSVALEPLAELCLARADSVDIPRSDFHGVRQWSRNIAPTYPRRHLIEQPT